MCGICGVIGGRPERERASVQRMTEALAHRGPDDSGQHGDEGAVLGNRRLAIIDLSHAGRQPLASSDGRYWITFNGEIYNYRELRHELEQSGVLFRTGTDTEVLLEAYRAAGPACLPRLRGMFAFAVWDSQTRTLFAARDAFGQKPFYYALSNGRFVFASEIKAILAHGDISATPDLAAVDCYLSLRFVPAPRTLFSAVRKLPAGCWLRWQEGDLRIGRYWTPEYTTAPERGEDDWLEELRARIEDAVADHMVSDVTVGAFLSGGLDSSTVVAAMRRNGAREFPTFCVGSDVARLDERAAARATARYCGTVHSERQAGQDVLRRIPWLVRCMDEPSDPIAACIDAAAALAAGSVKVVLGGDGGDEVFAGFDRYAAFDRVAHLARLPESLRLRLLVPLLRAVPESTRYKSLTQKAAWLGSVLSDSDGRQYARMTAHFRFQPEHRSWLYGATLREGTRDVDALQIIAQPFDQAPASSSLDRMIHADLLTRLPEHTLMLSDRLGMAYGLEIRSPLLDLRLARLCFSMPAHLRIRGSTTKYALRQAIREWLPPALVRRRKQGFMLPVGRWLQGGEVTGVARRLERGHLVREGWVRREGVMRLMREHAAGRADHHVRIWMLLSLEAWFGLYQAGEGIEEMPLDSVRAEVA